MEASGSLLVVVSILIWTSGLIALRSAAAAALVTALAATAAVTLHNSSTLLNSQTIRVTLWSALATGSLVKILVSSRRSETNSAGFVLLLSTSLAVTTIVESTLGRWTSLLVGLSCCFILSALARLLLIQHRNRKDERVQRALGSAIEGAYRRLELLPGDVRDKFAVGIVEALDSSPLRCLTMTSLGQTLGRPWEDAWVASALLEEQGIVSLSRQQFSPESTVALTDEGGERVNFRSITLIDNANFGDRSSIVTGDEYNISAANFTGAVGHNKVRDIISQSSGGQSQEITKEYLASQAREIAATLDVQKAKDLQEAADEVENARKPRDLRRAVHSIIGIASTIGEHGSALLDLAKSFMDGLGS